MPSLEITRNAAATANANNTPEGNNGQDFNHNQQAIDDARIIALKEQGNLTWASIAARFPGRTKGSIQVRYCRTLHKDGPARRAALSATAAPAAPAPPPAPAVVASSSSAPVPAPTPAPPAPRSRKRSAPGTTTADADAAAAAVVPAPAPKRARTTRTAAGARAAAEPAPAPPTPWREPTPIATIPAAQPVAEELPSARRRRGRAPPPTRSVAPARSARAVARQMEVVVDDEGVTVPARGGQSRVRLSTAFFGDYGKYSSGKGWGKARWEGFTGKYLR